MSVVSDLQAVSPKNHDHDDQHATQSNKTVGGRVVDIPVQHAINDKSDLLGCCFPGRFYPKQGMYSVCAV